jgi:hypothetical protein
VTPYALEHSRPELVGQLRDSTARLAPLLGWPLTLARFIPSVLLPPFMRLIGQWLFALLQGWPTYFGA